jgi:quinol monooxygenase YgiN
MSSPTLTLHVTWTVPPAQLPAFYSILHTFFEHLVQEEACLYFNVFEIAGHPGVIRFVEIFKGDIAWLREVSYYVN